MLSFSLDAPSSSPNADIMIIIWICAIIVFLTIEAFTSTLTTIWFACGAVVAAILAALDVSLEWQITIFVLASALMLILTRPLVKKYIKPQDFTY